jgi:hypothetical protein
MNLFAVLRRTGAADPSHRRGPDVRSGHTAASASAGAATSPRSLLVRLTPVVLGALAMLLLAGGGYALASGGSTVTVCVKRHGGTVYKAGTCHKHDGRLTLARTGKTGKTGHTGPAGATGPAGPPGPTGLVIAGTWAGEIQTIPANTKMFVFAGPTTTLTTTSGQTITASGSASIATSPQLGSADPPLEDFNVSICRQPASGGPVTVLDGNSKSDFEEVTADTTRIPFAVAMSGAPGAGSWRVGMCVENPKEIDLDDNDLSIGTAFVSNAKLTPPPVVVTQAGAAERAK